MYNVRNRPRHLSTYYVYLLCTLLYHLLYYTTTLGVQSNDETTPSTSPVKRPAARKKYIASTPSGTKSQYREGHVQPRMKVTCSHASTPSGTKSSTTVRSKTVTKSTSSRRQQLSASDDMKRHVTTVREGHVQPSHSNGMYHQSGANGIGTARRPASSVSSTHHTNDKPIPLMTAPRPASSAVGCTQRCTASPSTDYADDVRSAGIATGHADTVASEGHVQPRMKVTCSHAGNVTSVPKATGHAPDASPSILDEFSALQKSATKLQLSTTSVQNVNGSGDVLTMYLLCTHECTYLQGNG